MENDKKAEKGLAEFWFDFLSEEFKNETDRGAVVLTASLLENSLTNILKKHLVSNSSTEDELFDGANAPLSSFSAKIQISQRLGLISARLAKDLGLVRKMRNEFAHNVHGSSLNSGKIKDLLTNLTSSSSIVKGHYDLKGFPSGPRGEFLMTAHIILFYLCNIVEENSEAIPLQAHKEEWIYSWKYSKPDKTKNVNEQIFIPKKKEG